MVPGGGWRRGRRAPSRVARGPRPGLMINRVPRGAGAAAVGHRPEPAAPRGSRLPAVGRCAGGERLKGPAAPGAPAAASPRALGGRTGSGGKRTEGLRAARPGARPSRRPRSDLTPPPPPPGTPRRVSSRPSPRTARPHRRCSADPGVAAAPGGPAPAAPARTPAAAARVRRPWPRPAPRRARPAPPLLRRPAASQRRTAGPASVRDPGLGHPTVPPSGGRASRSLRTAALRRPQHAPGRFPRHCSEPPRRRKQPALRSPQCHPPTRSPYRMAVTPGLCGFRGFESEASSSSGRRLSLSLQRPGRKEPAWKAGALLWAEFSCL